MRKSVIILIILTIILSGITRAQDDTKLLRDLQERLERNKAEIVKEIRDTTGKINVEVSKGIDDNFAVLDTRMQDFFKGSVRDTAVVVVGGYLVAFTVSQIVRLKVEQKRNRALKKRYAQLHLVVAELEKKELTLNQKVNKWQQLDKKYSEKFEQFRNMVQPKKRFLFWRR